MKAYQQQEAEDELEHAGDPGQAETWGYGLDIWKSQDLLGAMLKITNPEASLSRPSA